MKYRCESLGKWGLELIHKLMDALEVPRGSGDKVRRGGAPPRVLRPWGAGCGVCAQQPRVLLHWLRALEGGGCLRCARGPQQPAWPAQLPQATLRCMRLAQSSKVDKVLEFLQQPEQLREESAADKVGRPACTEAPSPHALPAGQCWGAHVGTLGLSRR